MPKTLNTLWDPPFPFPKGAEDLPRRGVLAATPGLVNALKGSAPEPLEKICTLFMLGGTSIYSGRDHFLAGPVLGAPMAVMALEILVGGGAESLLFAGFAGSLTPGLALGDVFLPDRALSSEGASSHYPARLEPDEDLYSTLRIKAEKRGLFHPGCVWSTDGPMRETKALREAYIKQGAQAVEMEASALFAAARFRRARLAAILLITDLFHGEGWSDGFGGPRHKDGLKLVSDLAWEALEKDPEAAG
jgi:purine-nucleoside phosphorylase